MAKVFRKLNSFVKKNDIAVPVVLLLLAIFLCVCMYSGGKSVVEGFGLQKLFEGDSQDAAQGGGKKKMVLYHMETCPHCTRMMPDWQKFKSSATNVEVIDIEAKDIQNNSMLAQHTKQVSGFPTILMLNANGDKVIDVFTGDRTIEGFKKFSSEA